MTEALKHVPAPEEPYVVFTDMEWLRELSDEDIHQRIPDYHWRSIDLDVGFNDLRRFRSPEDIGGLPIGVDAVDQAVATGTPPSVSGAVIGTIDVDAVRNELEDRGWTGEELLRNDDLMSDGLALPMSQVRLEDELVFYSGRTVDLEDDFASAAGDERFEDQLDCLGDVVAGQIIHGVAVGVIPDENEEPRGVICAAGDPEELSEEIAEAVANGSNPYTGRSYSEDLVLPEADPHSQLARVYLSFPERGEHDQLLPTSLFLMHEQGQLPALADEADAEFRQWMEEQLRNPPGAGRTDNDS